MAYGIAYIATLISFLAVDAVWLAAAANALYRRTLGDILLPSFRIAPALVFYPMFAGGIVIFAVAPALTGHDWRVASVRGALFGLFSYGVYDFTNLATLRNWSVKLALIDVTWGTILTSLAATVGYGVAAYAAQQGLP